MENILQMVPDFVTDAVIDSLKLVPFLFVIFLFIEIFENYYSGKISFLLKYSKKVGPLFGALFAIIPQCGFSIVASLLYVKNFVSLGTLISVYIATSDEAIPILLANPSEFSTVGYLIFIKLLLAVVSGFAIDAIIKRPVSSVVKNTDIVDVEDEKGCCNHHLSENKKLNLFLHPIKHTFIIFLFILTICLVLNYLFEVFSIEKIAACVLNNSLIQPVFAGLFGLIPNCAVSVLITMMYLKGVLSFGSVIAGLSSGAGLGLLVLIKKNKSVKDTMMIIGLILFISIFSGILIEIFS